MGQRKIREILDRLLKSFTWYIEDGIPFPDDGIDRAIAEINKVVMECLPIKRTRIFDNDVNDGVAIGVNTAIRIFKSNWEAK